VSKSVFKCLQDVFVGELETEFSLGEESEVENHLIGEGLKMCSLNKLLVDQVISFNFFRLHVSVFGLNRQLRKLLNSLLNETVALLFKEGGHMILNCFRSILKVFKDGFSFPDILRKAILAEQELDVGVVEVLPGLRSTFSLLVVVKKNVQDPRVVSMHALSVAISELVTKLGPGAEPFFLVSETNLTKVNIASDALVFTRQSQDFVNFCRVLEGGNDQRSSAVGANSLESRCKTISIAHSM